MKEWLMEKRWRIILAGILVVAVPLVGLAVFVKLEATSMLEERIMTDNSRLSFAAADIIAGRLQRDMTIGKLFVS